MTPPHPSSLPSQGIPSCTPADPSACSEKEATFLKTWSAKSAADVAAEHARLAKLAASKGKPEQVVIRCWCCMHDCSPARCVCLFYVVHRQVRWKHIVVRRLCGIMLAVLLFSFVSGFGFLWQLKWIRQRHSILGQIIKAGDSSKSEL